MGASHKLKTWGREDPAVKLVVLTRNFGHQSAVSAGLSFACGDFVGVMDADLQDEPEILLKMLHMLQSERLEIVYAVRTSSGKRGQSAFFTSYSTDFTSTWRTHLYRSTAVTFA